MSRIHSTLIALLISAAATAGVYAAVTTVRLGQTTAAQPVAAHQLAARRAKLAAWNRSLHATLAKRPPKLPQLPHFAPVPVSHATPPSVATAQAPVTYVQAPTVVQYEHAPAPAAGSSDDGSGDDGAETGGDD